MKLPLISTFTESWTKASEIVDTLTSMHITPSSVETTRLGVTVFIDRSDLDRARLILGPDAWTDTNVIPNDRAGGWTEWESWTADLDHVRVCMQAPRPVTVKVQP